MRSIKLLVLLVAVLAVNATVFSQSADQYLRDFTEGKFRAKSPVSVVSMNDGERFAYISKDRKQIIACSYANGKEEVIFDIAKIEKCPLKEVWGFEFDKAEQKILINGEQKPIYRRSFITDYYVYNIQRNRIEPLSEAGKEQLAAFSPNGRIVAFARDNNLYLKKLDFDTESQITKDGKAGLVINGTPDWVYEEEFSNIRYFAFSPDNKLLAFVKFNEIDVRQYAMQEFDDTYNTFQNFKYPKAGQANSKVSVWVYDIENRTTTKMNIEGEDFYIPLIRWTQSSESLAVMKLSRNQKQMDLLSLNPRSGVPTKLYSETSKTYVDYQNFAQIAFNSDNSFVVMSEKDGYRHIYLHGANGLQKKQLTNGQFDVTALYGYDEKSQTVYFQAAKAHPTEREVYAAKNGKITALKQQKGYQTANFSKTFKYAILNYSDVNTPNVYSVINNSGKTLRTLEDNLALKEKFQQAGLPQKKFFEFTTPEGTTLNGWIMEPTQKTSGSTKIMMTQYSGPNSQEALNCWMPDWDYAMALDGFVVVCVDSRGTAAKGTEFRTCTYGKLGQLESKDQIHAANYLKQKYPNAEVGIWGWSYGGFMTLTCLAADETPFKAGVAIAPVTDWRLYNTAYTERFMNRPQENFEGYDQTSLLDKAGKINGNLLLIHGTSDDNVHVQNSYLMAEKLVEAGVEFDMHIYTNKNHSILGSKTRYNLYRKCKEFFKNRL